MRERWVLRVGSATGGFRYTSETGRPVRDRATLERIARLRIPPAWRDVHIASNPRASVQAWGFDARGRRQYRYHERAVERGQLRKFYRVRRMGHDLPLIRRRVARDFARRGFTRERVVAAAVRLLGEGFFRVGNERYERENRTFGLTTLRKSHVRLDGGRLIFSYRGKGSIDQRQVVVDPALARFVRKVRTAPGPRLFRYQADGKWHDLTSRDVNEYLQSLASTAYTAKDFRTWGGSLRMATVLGDLGPARSAREARNNVVLGVRLVAAELGNTPAICRASYVHPLIIARYLDNGVTIATEEARGAFMSTPSVAVRGPRKEATHTPEERALLAFLDRYFPERRRASPARRERVARERREAAAAA